MADPSPCLTIHKKLVAAVQSPDKYASGWKLIAEALPRLVRGDGFNYLQATTPGAIRRRLAGAKSLAKTFRAAAKADGGLLGKPRTMRARVHCSSRRLRISITPKLRARRSSGYCPPPRR